MNRAHETYLTQRILSADPVELVRMLYAGASEAVESARAHLAAGDIRGRSAAISKAMGILSELTTALNPESAPELSRKLAALYDYMQRRLIEANCGQQDAPLAEVFGLIRILAEGWQQVPAAVREKAAAPVQVKAKAVWTTWSHTGSHDPEPALHGWSF